MSVTFGRDFLSLDWHFWVLARHRRSVATEIINRRPKDLRQSQLPLQDLHQPPLPLQDLHHLQWLLLGQLPLQRSPHDRPLPWLLPVQQPLQRSPHDRPLPWLLLGQLPSQPSSHDRPLPRPLQGRQPLQPSPHDQPLSRLQPVQQPSQRLPRPQPGQQPWHRSLQGPQLLQQRHVRRAAKETPKANQPHPHTISTIITIFIYYAINYSASHHSISIGGCAKEKRNRHQNGFPSVDSLSGFTFTFTITSTMAVRTLDGRAMYTAPRPASLLTFRYFRSRFIFSAFCSRPFASLFFSPRLIDRQPGPFFFSLSIFRNPRPRYEMLQVLKD